ncbi:MAG: helicase C-terminal domain-containing protein, partial [Candidatus Nanoarchaeia archaeon]
PWGTSFVNAIKRPYKGLDNTNFVFYQRKPGCGFYEQFNSFIDADVIVFNALKYKLESALNRKPQTDVEIIDECDEFLDSFSNQKTINLDRLQNSLVHIFGEEEIVEKVVLEINSIIKQIKRNKEIEAAIYSKKIIPLKETKIYDLFTILLNTPEFFDELDEESYLFDVEETAKMFEGFFDESYLIFSKRDGNLFVSIVTTNLAKKFKKMADKNKILILMSGTIHSEEVLKNVFGLDEFKIIDAETEQQGKIDIIETGLEMDCRYSNLQNESNSREKYLRAFSKCLEKAKQPVLIHINSFADLPSEKELEEFKLDNLISREKLRQLQAEDKEGKIVNRFKKGQIDVLFSTRCARGIDFPGSQCNSIIFTKYPNPDIQDAFWKILKQTKPEHYWDFYKDKARRELLQKIYRGLRFKEDHIYLLSPDSRVLDAFRERYV